MYKTIDRKMKKLLFVLMTLSLSLGAMAQVSYGRLSPLHVEGNYFKDQHGNKVVLHGVMDTPNPYFNNYRWDGGISSTGATNCKTYFNKLFTAITDTTQGAYCNLFRLHLDPCWTNGNAGAWTQDSRESGTGEADISHYTGSKLTSYLKSLFFPIAQSAMKHGLYVIMRPPGVCPHNIYVGGSYQKYLLDVWDRVTQNDSILKYSGQISIELANEPVNLYMNDGSSSSRAMHDFFQPIVDKIRANGFTGIILVPGTGWQSNYRDYATYPIEGYNIGYAVHNYAGWYDNSDDHCDVNNAIKKFGESVPVLSTNPIVITEVDWSPHKPEAQGHYDEHGNWVVPNYGTWATASTSKWGKAYKAILDYYGNISMTLTGTGDFIDIDAYINNRKVVPAFKTAMEANGVDPYEACGVACFEWYKEYYHQDYPGKSYTRAWTADQGNGTYINPIINADFPDVDVIRVDDTYYMVSTTMYHFPGATILKSKDLVNWEYCANPLEKILDNDDYSLLNGKHHYAQGMWASSLSYHDGKFYLYFPCSTWAPDRQSILLTATNPEGQWEDTRLSGIYHDPGWLFDDGENGDGNLYVACGINNIDVIKMNPKTFKEIEKKTVISKNDAGLEGTHMYHIGDYYYLYCTYNHGDYVDYFTSSQTIFRSTNPMGPYEECPYRVFYDSAIHQGALVQTQTGEWWTMLFKDAGAVGRIPYLEPVVWENGWPVIGNNGVDVSKAKSSSKLSYYKKPDVGAFYERTYLPTNETFTSPRLGMQWQWNHNPDNGAWSLMANPGNMRLYTANVTDYLVSARNSLSQRIFGTSPEGTSQIKYMNSYGTIKMDISHMEEGDVAGLSVFQNPYSFIAVKMENGKKHLYSQRCTFDGQNHAVAETLNGDEVNADVIYLRAIVNFATKSCKYYYSIDNAQWIQWGVTMTMNYTLDFFVGQRFYLFNFATQELGGYVDIDWFSTEPEYTEEMYYAPGTLQTFTEDDLIMESLKADVTKVSLMPGSSKTFHIVSTAKSGMQNDVTSSCSYVSSNPEVATVKGGRIVGLQDGEATITATYYDIMQNSQSVTINVSVSPFPLTKENFNPSIFASGTFDENKKTFRAGQNGFGGWTYSAGLDLSAYNYLVVKLKYTATSCAPSFRLFDANNYWGDAYIKDFGSSKKIKIDLHDMKASNGKVIDPSHIYIAGFWTNGSSSIYIDDVFLSMDGTNPIATDIEGIELPEEVMGVSTEISTLDGRRLARPEKGINIIKKTYSDGTVETKKILVQ